MEEAKELVVIIRPSFMKFCKDGCRAAAFNHILYWIARKAKGQPQEKIQNGEIAWYATTEEVTEGLANAWGVCKVRQEVNALITMGIIGRDKNRQWGADRTKHFIFGKEQCSKLLELCQEYSVCLHAIGLSTDVIQMINISFAPEASDKTIVCKCGYHQMQIIDPSDAHAQANDKSIEAITKVKDSTKVSNKGDDRVPPHLQSFHLLYSKSRFFRGSKKMNTDKLAHYEDLAPEIITLEQLERLYRIAGKRNYGNDKNIYLGNLVSALPEWREPSQQIPEGQEEAWLTPISRIGSKIYEICEGYKISGREPKRRVLELYEACQGQIEIGQFLALMEQADTGEGDIEQYFARMSKLIVVGSV